MNDIQEVPEVRMTEWGYYELVDKPTLSELRKFYAEKYYQQSVRTHQSQYSQDELKWKEVRLGQKMSVAKKLMPMTSGRKCFLDVGAGEGFAMAYFSKFGWDVTGIDYSNHGCSTHNPRQLTNLIAGNINDSLLKMNEQGRRFDLILLDNVLEHMLEPLVTLNQLKLLLSDSGRLIIEVPNDFSVLQQHLLAAGHIQNKFWIVSPDHISYFNSSGLRNLCEGAGLRQFELMSDFPIDLALLNAHTNYSINKEVGSSVHKARMEIETLVHEISPAMELDLYKAFANLGLGRSLVGFFGISNPENEE